jgi:NAD(P)H-flavin reductase/ferredoxin
MFDRLFRRGPSEFNLQINPLGKQVRVQAKESLLAAALNQGIAFPHNCRVGGCGECKCKLVSGKVKELTDKSYLLSAEELQQNYILACQAQPRTDVVIEVDITAAAVASPLIDTQASIDSLTPLTRDILHVRLRLDTAMPFEAGQCAELVIPSEAGAAAGAGRSYSFATAPNATEGKLVDFFIRQVPGGAFTSWLFTQAKVGTRLSLRGPLGNFRLGKGKSPLLCIAGGSGLAPIKAMLEQAAREGHTTRPVTVLLAARTQVDVYGQDMLADIFKQWMAPSKVEAVLSAEPESSNWTGRRGLVSEHLQAIMGSELARQDVYLCGPPPMIDACEAMLKQAGVPAAQVHADRFLDASHLAGAISR